MMQINADVGEIAELISDGRQEELLGYVTMVNIACGGHAGTAETMRISVEQARRRGLRIGAHPGYADRENFGRVAVAMELDAVSEMVFGQVRELAKYTDEIGHVKPHGALYNEAAVRGELARAIARGVAGFSREVTLVGLAGSVMLKEFGEEGFAVMAEGFADRRYTAEGTLVARGLPGAVITDAGEAAEQVLRLRESGRVQTICVHGDTAGAAGIARAVAQALLR
jgi:UPF0271 protein